MHPFFSFLPDSCDYHPDLRRLVVFNQACIFLIQLGYNKAHVRNFFSDQHVDHKIGLVFSELSKLDEAMLIVVKVVANDRPSKPAQKVSF